MSLQTVVVSIGGYITACWHDILNTAPKVVNAVDTVIDKSASTVEELAAAAGQPAIGAGMSALKILADDANAAIKAATPTDLATGKVTVTLTPEVVSGFQLAWQDAESFFSAIGAAITHKPATTVATPAKAAE